MAEIKKIDVLSMGKISGILYAIIGLVVGLVITILSVTNMAIPESMGPLGTLGPYAVALMPIIYGIVGFVAGIIIAALYNLLVRWVGGIKIELK